MCLEQTSVANGMYWDGSKHNASDVPQTTILFYRVRRDKGLLILNGLILYFIINVLINNILSP